MSKDLDAADLAFRERIRDAIQSGGKSAVISQKTGIPIGTLNKYVSLRSEPSASNALKIARAVGLTVEELLEGKSSVDVCEQTPDENRISRKLASEFERLPAQRQPLVYDILLAIINHELHK